jgi:hypothetical protein
MTFIRTERELARALMAIKRQIIADGGDAVRVRLLRDGAGWRVETGEGDGAGIWLWFNHNCRDGAQLLLGRAERMERGEEGGR